MGQHGVWGGHTRTVEALTLCGISELMPFINIIVIIGALDQMPSAFIDH